MTNVNLSLSAIDRMSLCRTVVVQMSSVKFIVSPDELVSELLVFPCFRDRMLAVRQIAAARQMAAKAGTLCGAAVMTNRWDNADHTLRIRQINQQGCPLSSVSEFVYVNYRLERSPTNQVDFINSSSLFGRHHSGGLDADLSTLMYLEVILFPEVNVKNDQAESSVFNPFSKSVDALLTSIP